MDGSMDDLSMLNMSHISFSLGDSALERQEIESINNEVNYMSNSKKLFTQQITKSWEFLTEKSSQKIEHQ